MWFTGGEEKLNLFELPSARLLNSIAGRSELIDLTIIFLNNFYGEALFVVIALTAYFIFAARFMTGSGRRKWIRIFVFAVFIFCVWLITDRISNRVEEIFRRDSPSYYMDEDLVNLDDMYPDREVKVYARTSLPSNHGNVFFVLFLICLYRWRWKALWLGVLAVILSTPRMLTGAHWITDTLLGSLLLSWMMTAIFAATPIFDYYLQFEEKAGQKIPAYMSPLIKRLPFIK